MNILKIFGFGLCTLIVIIVLYLAAIIFFPVLGAPETLLSGKTNDSTGLPPRCRQNVEFLSGGQAVRAWLYLSGKPSRPVPCVVMSQGFGGTRDFILEQYALKFVDAGFAVLSYDYRHFGESGGEPRQLFDPALQIDDFRAAIRYARSRKEIDPKKIVLWSTSASGGYGLIIAAEDRKIAAVIAQCPELDQEADRKMFIEREGVGSLLRLFMHAQRDKGRSRLGLPAHTIPIVGKPGDLAILTAPGAYEGYENLAKGSGTFKNEVCARMILMKDGPSPLEASKKVACPVLFLICEKDNVVSPDGYQAAAMALGGKATVKTFPIGHFDIYQDPYFETAVDDMVFFSNLHCGHKPA